MCSTWTGVFGHRSVLVSQRQAPEKEPSTQPLSLETTWWSMVRIQKISRYNPAIIHPCYPVYIYLFSSRLSLPGGNVHIHYQEEKCYDEEIFFYHLGCHQWVSAGERWSLSEFICLLSQLSDTVHSFHLQLVIVTCVSIPTVLTNICFL